MRPTATTLLVIGCLGALAFSLWGRMLVYRQAAPQAPVEDATQAVDPATPPLVLHYHERPPYYSAAGDGTVQGLCAEPVRRALERAGIAFVWQATPPTRQLRSIQSNRRAECAVGWFRTPERASFARFSRPIYQDQPTVALARKEAGGLTDGQLLDQALAQPGLRLLVKEGYSYGEFIDDAIARLRPRLVVTTSDHRRMADMLLAGRADFFFIAAEEAADLLARLPDGTERLRLVRFRDMPAGNHRHLMCSATVAEAILDRIDRSLRDPSAAAPDPEARP